MSPPRVTIVTPSLNQAPFLEESIESVLGQGYPNLEYFVVDGGSSDGSVEIIRRYADHLDWWTSEPDRGQAAALNSAFRRATGEYLGWINSDDTLLPGAIERAVGELVRHPDALLTYGDAIFVDEAGRSVGYFKSEEMDVREMLRTCKDWIVQQGSLFRRDAFEAVGGLNDEGFFCFDFELMLSLGLAGRVVRIDEPLATYRLHKESKSLSASLGQARDFVRMYDTFFLREDLPDEIQVIRREAVSRAYLTAAEHFFAALDRRNARRYLVAALRLYPRHATPFALFLLAKTFLPDRAVTRLRRLRRQLRVRTTAP